MKTITKLWVLIIILAILAPVGLMLPAYFKAGAAWGEWSPEDIKALIGYMPKGLERLSSFWCAPIPDYVFKGWVEKSIGRISLAYAISGITGIAVTIGIIFLIGKFLGKKE